MEMKSKSLLFVIGICSTLALAALNGLQKVAYGQESVQYYTSNKSDFVSDQELQRTVSLKSILKKIEKSHNISFLYDNRLIKDKYGFVSDIKTDRLANYLGESLSRTGLTYLKQTERTYVIMAKES